MPEREKGYRTGIVLNLREDSESPMALLIAGLVIFLGVHTLTTLRATRAGLLVRLGDGG
jgi:hypothetical protein